jgi:hypothetical protein
MSPSGGVGRGERRGVGGGGGGRGLFGFEVGGCGGGGGSLFGAGGAGLLGMKKDVSLVVLRRIAVRWGLRNVFCGTVRVEESIADADAGFGMGMLVEDRRVEDAVIIWG